MICEIECSFMRGYTPSTDQPQSGHLNARPRQQGAMRSLGVPGVCYWDFGLRFGLRVVGGCAGAVWVCDVCVRFAGSPHGLILSPPLPHAALSVFLNGAWLPCQVPEGCQRGGNPT